MARIRIRRGQSVTDIALTYYGNIEGVKDIISRNNLPGPTANLYSHDEMREHFTEEQITRLREIDQFYILQIQDGLRPRRLVASGNQIRTKGIGYDRIGIDTIQGEQLTPARSFGPSFGPSFG